MILYDNWALHFLDAFAVICMPRHSMYSSNPLNSSEGNIWKWSELNWQNAQIGPLGRPENCHGNPGNKQQNHLNLAPVYFSRKLWWGAAYCLMQEHGTPVIAFLWYSWNSFSSFSKFIRPLVRFGIPCASDQVTSRKHCWVKHGTAIFRKVLKLFFQ